MAKAGHLMCVAAVCFGDAPPLAWLKKMEKANPHGAGVAWCRGDEVVYVKGIKADEVRYAMEKVPKPALFHFRWATHGGKKAHLTHPFPLGDEALWSEAVNGAAPTVLIHNGTWGEYEKFVPAWAKKFDYSDTAVAAYMADADENILDEVRWATALLHADRRVKLRGEWHLLGGTLYSNLNWLGAGETWDWLK